MASQHSPTRRPAPFRSASCAQSLQRLAVRSALAVVGGLSISATLSPAPAQAFVLTPPGGYLNVKGSSEFGTGYEASKLFDADPSSAWVIGGALGANPQGRDEAWLSFALDRDFIISQLSFTPRGATGTVDGIDRLQIWGSLNPFGVDVTDATSTAAFLASALPPSFQTSGFAVTVTPPYSYRFKPVSSRYFLVRLLNQSDTRSDRNLGGKFLELKGSPMVPGPLPVVGVATAFAASRRLRRRCRLG